MSSLYLFVSGVGVGACLLALVQTILDARRASREEQTIQQLQREASQYARAWATERKRRTNRSALGDRLRASTGGNSAA